MSFRRRAPVQEPPIAQNSAVVGTAAEQRPHGTGSGLPRGVKASALDGSAVTSSGCRSLDAVLCGHGGLLLGRSYLLGERGTTDHAAVLLRSFAAEGLLQGHDVWLGPTPMPGSAWFASLPAPLPPDAPSEERTERRTAQTGVDREKMQIAWRYNALGNFGSGLREDADGDGAFCHGYDLTKRIDRTLLASARLHTSPPPAPSSDPFAPILSSLVRAIDAVTSHAHGQGEQRVLRCVLPGLLSPACYPAQASQQRHFLRFVQTLRLLLRQHAASVLLVASAPLDLYPRDAPLMRWAEHLFDASIALEPLPPQVRAGDTVSAVKLSLTSATTASRDTTTTGADAQDGPQGLVRVHKAPGMERPPPTDARWLADLSFKCTRRRFAIEAWSLGVLDGGQPREAGALDEASMGASRQLGDKDSADGHGTASQTKVDVSF